MNYLWNLARKNLSRSKLRTSISIIAIAIAIISVTFARGLINGMIESTYQNHIYYKAGHVRVIDNEYELKERILSLNHSVDGFSGEGASMMADKLKEVEGVTQVVPRIKFGAVVIQEDELVRMLGWGIDPAEEIKFTQIDKDLSEGRMVQPGNREIVMGSGLMKKLNREVEDKVTIVYATPYGSIKGSTLKIVGKIQSSLPLINDNVFYLPIEQAQEMLEMPGQVSELLLITPDYKNAGSVLPALTKLFAQEDKSNKYILQIWDEVGELVALFKIAINMYNFIYVFIIVLASFVLINTLIMIINERTREIGMMTALGLKSREILYLFVMEGVTIGAIGSFIGAIFGGLITKMVSVTGIDYSAAMEGMSADLMFDPIFYPVFSLENLIFCFFLGVLVVTIACIIPARRAAHLEPTEALRQI